ncbi:NAD/NADP transhydrogenase alpha subunit [Chengkuizengella axinellae]|uniref:NAD/NADP transhydrogenase alpha subunit n=1 Tax=Chengkuizengella axinellae TaxID=3064388 RepID=A0ABT9IX04_9BACL|nr:NAD/NADP transhydrogenase alpha subunit [Chengkuizengella sp. 2205SS18-9]MDP5273893.1 NAD/NADP transhydrogenase alpha subunit [Chengkuizengella sp. 2205SS18-9]
MKCITVYTKSFEEFSDIFEEILRTPLAEDEEKVIEGITVSDSGEVPMQYIDRMRDKPEVVVMKVKEEDITIFQHGEVFEILIPEKETVV